jgi:hypothetical protein
LIQTAILDIKTHPRTASNLLIRNNLTLCQALGDLKHSGSS